MPERVRKRRDEVRIVTLLGSTRFKDEFLKVAKEEGLKGNLVFTVNWFTHADGSCGEEAENKFQALHFDKIDVSDECVVVNPQTFCCNTCGSWVQQYTNEVYVCRNCGVKHIDQLVVKKYVGSQTKKEIEYCFKHDIPVRYVY